ncbi:MAG: serine hydroxymethyltransferase, partial [Candidatus Yonathbacteria bacterium]|nr:serine hydroxymethyltransferase [Candidatus Yonathbacteria bacterium]
KQIKKNAKALEKIFATSNVKLMFGGTDNHMLLIDVTPLGISGKEAQEVLDSVGITLNKNMIPDDPRSPMDPSGIRLGTPALTTRGLKETDMEHIAETILDVLTHRTDNGVKDRARAMVKEMSARYPLYPDFSYL